MASRLPTVTSSKALRTGNEWRPQQLHQFLDIALSIGIPIWVRNNEPRVPYGTRGDPLQQSALCIQRRTARNRPRRLPLASPVQSPSYTRPPSAVRVTMPDHFVAVDTPLAPSAADSCTSSSRMPDADAATPLLPAPVGVLSIAPAVCLRMVPLQVKAAVPSLRVLSTRGCPC
jgi:hypothetical protein